MRALVWDGQDLKSDEVEVRPPEDGEVSVRITTAGLCQSDLSPIVGKIPVDTPIILGHEAVGTVVESRAPAVVAGQRVVMSVLRRCGLCAQCKAGRPTRCEVGSAPVRSPFTRRGETVHQFVRLGAFAEQIVVAAHQVVPVPDELSEPIAAMLGCATVTAFGAVEERAQVRPGDSVLVTGAGGIGLNAVIAAHAAGATRIIVVDRNPAKRSVALACGATDFIVPTNVETVAATVRSLVPGGVDAALECVGHNGLLGAAIEALAYGGRVVVVGLPGMSDTLPLNTRALFHDKAILGCRMGSVDPLTALPVLARRSLAGEIDLAPLVSKIVPLDEANDLVDDLRNGRVDRGFIDFRAGPS